MRLGTDVITFNMLPSPPDLELQTDFKEAMTLEAAASTACASSDWTLTTDDLNQGTTWLNKATARIRQIVGG